MHAGHTRQASSRSRPETERTLFFDFLLIDLDDPRFQRHGSISYTVPGQVFYNASRKLILKGVDGIVFVGDSQIERAEAEPGSRCRTCTTTWPNTAMI